MNARVDQKHMAAIGGRIHAITVAASAPPETGEHVALQRYCVRSAVQIRAIKGLTVRTCRGHKLLLHRS